MLPKGKKVLELWEFENIICNFDFMELDEFSSTHDMFIMFRKSTETINKVIKSTFCEPKYNVFAILPPT